VASVFKGLAFLVIWGCVFGSTYLIGNSFGFIAGLLYFLFVAGLAGFLGMLVVMGLAKLFGIDMEE